MKVTENVPEPVVSTYDITGLTKDQIDWLQSLLNSVHAEDQQHQFGNGEWTSTLYHQLSLVHADPFKFKAEVPKGERMVRLTEGRF